MSIKDKFEVKEIPTKIAKPFILKKHYAERKPAIQHSFGLHRNQDLVGVCTFGPPCRAEQDVWKPDNCFELNRLVTEEGLPKNSLSYFVSHSLDMLPSPCIIVSYADPNSGHHGFIYQATNFIYTGRGRSTKIFKNINTGEEIHERSVVSSLVVVQLKNFLIT